MDLINPKAQVYAEKYSLQEDNMLNEIESSDHGFIRIAYAEW